MGDRRYKDESEGRRKYFLVGGGCGAERARPGAPRPSILFRAPPGRTIRKSTQLKREDSRAQKVNNGGRKAEDWSETSNSNTWKW